jgi:hypothetical protein
LGKEEAMMRLKGEQQRILKIITDEARPECSRPWHVTHQGNPWTVTSDGFRLLAMEGHLGEYHVPPPGVSKLTDVLELVFEPHKLLELSGEQFIAFWQEYIAPRGSCSHCGARCEECSPAGGASRKATYGGVPFNLDWIAEILESLHPSFITVSLHGEILRLASNGWIYIQMGMRLGSVEGLPKIEDAAGVVTNG